MITILIFVCFSPHFKVAGLPLLWNLRLPSGDDPSSPPAARPLPGPWLPGVLLSVRQTTGQKAAPGAIQAAKVLGNEGFKTHLF